MYAQCFEIQHLTSDWCQFTIIDSGGDGLCCGEGQGSYKISYDGKELNSGGVFYDSESTPFGLCGATLAPTNEPTIKTKPSGAAGASNSGMGYRCVAKSLAERGYKISADKCNLFDDCFNPQIKVGDDWFCDDSSTCIEATACGTETGTNGSNAGAETVTAAETVDEESNRPPLEPLESDNTPSPSSSDTTHANVSSVATRPPKVTVADSGNNTIIENPGNKTLEPESSVPTLVPTTSAPTLGPCMGEPCNQRDHCRSRYGFCVSALCARF